MTDRESGESVPPEWAIERVMVLTNAQWPFDTTRTHPVSAAFARYIAEHEQAPVDPLLLEAREIVAHFYDTDPKLNDSVIASKTRAGLKDERPEVQQAVVALRRGIELARTSPNTEHTS